MISDKHKKKMSDNKVKLFAVPPLLSVSQSNPPLMLLHDVFGIGDQVSGRANASAFHKRYFCRCPHEYVKGKY